MPPRGAIFQTFSPKHGMDPDRVRVEANPILAAGGRREAVPVILVSGVGTGRCREALQFTGGRVLVTDSDRNLFRENIGLCFEAQDRNSRTLRVVVERAVTHAIDEFLLLPRIQPALL